jgi:hypothetical protein
MPFQSPFQRTTRVSLFVPNGDAQSIRRRGSSAQTVRMPGGPAGNPRNWKASQETSGLSFVWGLPKRSFSGFITFGAAAPLLSCRNFYGVARPPWATASGCLPR